ncbi:MAG: thioredoxin family protein [Candidatus Sumerlaeia bacterium]
MSEKQKKSGVAIKVLIVLALAVVVGAAIVAKNTPEKSADPEAADKQADSATATQESSGETSKEKATANAKSKEATTQALPKLVDLGAKSCVPCKMMAPILKNLQEEYSDQFETVFIDVWENRAAGSEYGIRVIPTQIFFDADGKELFRHEGFYSKEDILGKWQELGISIKKTADE